MKEQVKMRLRVNAVAESRSDLIQKLYDQAVAFFGDEEFVLEGEVDVGPSTEVSRGGKVLVVMWEGDASFVSERR